jgi:hypothetical protein
VNTAAAARAADPHQCGKKVPKVPMHLSVIGTATPNLHRKSLLSSHGYFGAALLSSKSLCDQHFQQT